MHPKNFNPLLPQSSRDYDGDKYSKKSAGSLSTVTKLILCVIFLLILKSSWSYYKADDSILTFPSNVSDSKIIDPSLLSVDTINNQNLPTKDIPKESQDQKQKSNEPDLPKVALGPTANSEQSKDPKIAIGPDIPSTNPTPDDVDKTPSEGTVNSERLEAVMKATLHSFSSYRKYAWGFDELKPVSKTGFDTGYKMGLTIIDSLDTLYIMGKNNPEIHKEFKLARDWVNEKLLFDHGEVNLFETTIRVLGGLLATYHLTKDDMFLNKAKLLGDKLLPGFDTNSGIPFASVDFEKGKGVEAVGMEGSSTSEVTTLGLEFMYLSILTNDKKYKDKIDIIQARISKIEPESCLVPIYISPKTGNYVGSTIRLGSRADSYYEYLFKVSLFAKDNQYFEMWQRSWTSIKTWLFVKSPTQGYWFPGEMDDGVPNWVSTTIKELLGKDPGIEYRKKRLEKMESRPDLSVFYSNYSLKWII